VTYVDDFAVCVIDESVEEDVNAFVAPDAQELVNLVEAVWRRHRQTVVDTRQVAQVEDVVKLGRRRRQVTNHSPDTNHMKSTQVNS